MTPYVQRKGGVSSVSSSGLVEQLVQVQLNQEKVDAINEKLMELIDTQLEVAHTQLEEAEAKIKAGRAEYDKQFKNFGNTVSNTVMGTLSSEVGEAVEGAAGTHRGAGWFAAGHGQVQQHRYAGYRLPDRDRVRAAGYHR